MKGNKKLKRNIGLLLIFCILLTMTSGLIIANAVIVGEPMLSVTINPYVEVAQRGEYILVDIDVTPINGAMWHGALINLFYDDTRLELVPYDYNYFYFNGISFPKWVESRGIWTMFNGNVGFNPQLVGGFLIASFTFPNASLPFPAQTTWRFRVRDDAPDGVARIGWSPRSASADFWTLLPFVEPSVESIGSIIISDNHEPRLDIAINPQEDVAQPGEYILVDIDMIPMNNTIWSGAFINVFYDNTRLELVPYAYNYFEGLPPIPRWVGTHGTWTMFGGAGGLNTNTQIDSGHVVANFEFPGFGEFPFPAQTTWRFRVRDDAPDGVAGIAWSPRAASNQTEELMFVEPGLMNFGSVIIGAGSDEDQTWVHNFEELIREEANKRLVLRPGMFMYGDASGDGIIGNLDLILLMRYTLGFPVEICYRAADVNVNGVIDNGDFAILRNYLMGIPTHLGSPPFN